MLGISKVWMKWDILGWHVYLFPCPCCKYFGKSKKRKKGGMLTAQQEFSLDLIYGSGLIVVIPHTDIDKLYLSCLRRQLFLLVLFESGGERPWARSLAKVHGFIDHYVCHVKNNLYPSGVMPLGRSRVGT